MSEGSTPPIAVTTLGMVTALGRTAVTSCAAARAGLSRSKELEILDFRHDALYGDETPVGGPIVFGNTALGVADGFSGPARLLLLAGAALDDLLQQRKLTERDLIRTGFALNLSDHAMLDADAAAAGGPLPSEAWRRQTARFHARLTESRSLPVTPPHHILHHGGSAGMAAAVADAMSMLGAGSVDRCVVGAVDSRADTRFLPAAARLGQLRTGDNPAGLIPGEAAAFLLLERLPDALRTGVTPLAILGPAVAAREPTTLLDPETQPSGAGLAQVLRVALAGGRVDLLIGDLNGTTRRAVEWGHTLLRLRTEGLIEGVPAWLPAMAFGDTGAAAGAVGACLAARALSRGYAPGPAALVWMSSESGMKGAFAIRATPR